MYGYKYRKFMFTDAGGGVCASSTCHLVYEHLQTHLEVHTHLYSRGFYEQP